MYVERLRLTDFRNYHDLDLSLPHGLIVFAGRNAQGKSNLLEAIALVATSRSFRTTSEREAVRWHAPAHFARIDAQVARRKDALHVEIVISDLGLPGEGIPARPEVDPALPQPPPAQFRKRIRVNGSPRRAIDLLGQVTVVVFAPTDLDLVIGSPAERRRFLDITLCQVHPAYCRALSQYQKIVTQRAALLRRIRDNEESAHALTYWDDQLATLAAPIIRQRAAFLHQTNVTARRVYATLAHENDLDDADIDPTDRVAPSQALAAAAVMSPDDPPVTHDETGETGLQLVYHPAYTGPLAGSDAEMAAAMKAQLAQVRRREIAQGVNVVGPHRDDLAFLAGGVDLATYGSRGQQRSVALALKLAELAYIERETGDQPILLLDDVLSELDARRRSDLLAAVRGLDQVLLTTTDLASLPDEALGSPETHIFRVRAGNVSARHLPT